MGTQFVTHMGTRINTHVGPQNDIWGVSQVHTACNTLQICMSKGLDLVINPPCCKSYSNKNRQTNLSCSIYFILFYFISLTDFVNPLKKPISSRYAEGLFQKYLRSDGKTFNVSPLPDFMSNSDYLLWFHVCSLCCEIHAFYCRRGFPHCWHLL